MVFDSLTFSKPPLHLRPSPLERSRQPLVSSSHTTQQQHSPAPAAPSSRQLTAASSHTSTFLHLQLPLLDSSQQPPRVLLMQLSLLLSSSSHSSCTCSSQFTSSLLQQLSLLLSSSSHSSCTCSSRFTSSPLLQLPGAVQRRRNDARRCRRSNWLECDSATCGAGISSTFRLAWDDPNQRNVFPLPGPLESSSRAQSQLKTRGVAKMSRRTALST